MIMFFLATFFTASLIAPSAIAATSSGGKVTPAPGCKWVGRAIICPDDKPKQSIAQLQVPGRTDPKRRVVVAVANQDPETSEHRGSGRKSHRS